jgi:hypothetical protein
MQKSLKRAAAALALGAGASALLAGSAFASSAGPSISIRAALAPNVYSGTTAWDAWELNAITAMEQGKRVVGPANSPAQFRQVSTIGTRDLIVTGFPSFKGVADPADAFGAAYANEMGTRPTFVTRIKPRHGRTITIASGLQFVLHSNDSANYFGYTPADIGVAAPGYASYDGRLVGVRYGSDGKPGGGDDALVTSGSQAVNEIISFRPGNADSTDPADPVATLDQQQTALDKEADYLRTLGVTQLSASVTFMHRTATSSLTVSR